MVMVFLRLLIILRSRRFIGPLAALCLVACASTPPKLVRATYRPSLSGAVKIGTVKYEASTLMRDFCAPLKPVLRNAVGERGAFEPGSVVAFECAKIPAANLRILGDDRDTPPPIDLSDD